MILPVLLLAAFRLAAYADQPSNPPEAKQAGIVLKGDVVSNQQHDLAHLAQNDGEPHDEYIMELATLRWKLAREGNEGWKAVDAEIGRHPMDHDDNPALNISFAAIRAGTWHSPRHDYLCKRDQGEASGTWVMDPTPGEDTTHGTWSIRGNIYCENIPGKPERAGYVIILLNNENFIYMDKESRAIFYETRTLHQGLPIRRDDP